MAFQEDLPELELGDLLFKMFPCLGECRAKG